MKASIFVSKNRYTAAVCLGAVEREIGIFNELIRIRSVTGRDCDTNANSHHDLLAVDLIWRAYCINESCRERNRICGPDECGLYDPKLVSPQSSHHVGLTDTAAHAPGHRLQQLVSGGMSKRIIDALKAVKVQTKDRKASTLWYACEEFVHFFMEEHPIRQIRKGVVMGHV